MGRTGADRQQKQSFVASGGGGVCLFFCLGMPSWLVDYLDDDAGPEEEEGGERRHRDAPPDPEVPSGVEFGHRQPGKERGEGAVTSVSSAWVRAFIRGREGTTKEQASQFSTCVCVFPSSMNTPNLEHAATHHMSRTMLMATKRKKKARRCRR